MKGSLLMFSLWLLTKVQAECPQTCKCTTTSVSCIDQNLESVPNLNSLESSPVILDFSGNKIYFITEEDFTFPESDEVKEIYLNNSGIADIGQGAFDKVDNLQELYLGQNFLSSSNVPETLIEKLDNMVLLDMSKNYFNGDMPIIRSQSLEVLALVNSKISSIPEKALKYLPNLKLLLLQQNNIQSLSYDPFKNYAPRNFFAKLVFNPWKCSCDNLRAFYLLSRSKFVETTDEPYQCINDENTAINIFSSNGVSGLFTKQCETRDLVIEDTRLDFKYLETPNDTFLDGSEEDFHVKDDKKLDIKQVNDTHLEYTLPGNCWEIFTNAYSENNFLKALILSILVSFFIGFITGLFFCRILYIFRYKKLEQSSDSQVQLLGA